MKRCLTLVMVTLVTLTAAHLAAVPTLLVNGVNQTAVRGSGQPLAPNSATNEMDWSMVNQVTDWLTSGDGQHAAMPATMDIATIPSGSAQYRTNPLTEMAPHSHVGPQAPSDLDVSHATVARSAQADERPTRRDGGTQSFVPQMAAGFGVGSLYALEQGFATQTVASPAAQPMAYAGGLALNGHGLGHLNLHVNHGHHGLKGGGGAGVTPEPATLLLFGLGLLGARFARRKQ